MILGRVNYIIKASEQRAFAATANGGMKMPIEFNFLPAFLIDADGQRIGAIQDIQEFSDVTTTTDDAVGSVFNPITYSFSFTFNRATRGYRQLNRELHGWIAKGPIRWREICKALRLKNLLDIEEEGK